MNYTEFLASKKIEVKPSGFTVEQSNINPLLFQFQKDIVSWSLQKGKSCIFAGTGLGKTLMQLEWAKHVRDHIDGNVLIVAPLAVVEQTKREGQKIDVNINICKYKSDVIDGINITNYERLDNFDVDEFDGVVLDESSILKSFEGKIRTNIINKFNNTPFKLACTATPSPNDTMELMNHAEFVGVMTRTEALSLWFVHDGGETQKWRLKGHAVKSFWEWVASWAVMLNLPSDLGYEDNGFKLTPLNISQIVVDDDGYMIREAKTLTDRRDARRNSLDKRIKKASDIANSFDEPVIVWCDLNIESEMLRKNIKDSIEVKGSQDSEYKADMLNKFSKQEYMKLISKPSIAGFGMNWQHCSKMIFTGLSDSFEQYYQAVRRCWRFGQTKPVDVYVITSKAEGAVVKNIERKEKEFNEMLSGMIAATQEITKKNIRATYRNVDEYIPTVEMTVPSWLVSETLNTCNTDITSEVISC